MGKKNARRGEGWAGAPAGGHAQRPAPACPSGPPAWPAPSAPRRAAPCPLRAPWAPGGSRACARRAGLGRAARLACAPSLGLVLPGGVGAQHHKTFRILSGRRGVLLCSLQRREHYSRSRQVHFGGRLRGGSAFQPTAQLGGGGRWGPRPLSACRRALWAPGSSCWNPAVANRRPRTWKGTL